MSQLPIDITVLQTVATGGEDGFPQAEVGGGRRGPAPMRPEEVRGGPVAAAAARRGPVAVARGGPAAARGGPAATARGTPAAAARGAPAAAARGTSVAAAARGAQAAAPRGASAAAAAREGPAAASAARGGPVAREGQLGAVSREVRMAEVARLLGEPLEEEGPENRPRSRASQAANLAALPYLRLRHPLSVLGINYQQFLRQYLENYPIAPGRIQELEERRRRFVEACRAREAAFDAEYMRNPQRVDFDILTFTIALTASEVINPLIEELGCDRFINRE
ncbi:EP300-interacting inhibitor of differentiation 2 [Heterocephalus glaber]|uniref:EP300-interacting inhibitor of differentiation 2 n=2 Tax=Heterocephalus glaber TaxID=10181 RepID=A0AAX6PU49_HETGA|nr:EP300-interacting inhibitor of differentiation 2 [Heterocephalus glaber]